MSELGKLRESIDRIDGEILQLFRERMQVVSSIAEYKKEQGLPVIDPVREAEKLARISGGGEYKLMSALFEISRNAQSLQIETADYSKHILVINGANLNMLGIREPEIYGSQTYADLVDFVQAVGRKFGVGVKCVQSNCEGELVNFIQSAYTCKFDGIVINPGAYTHTSIAIADALKAVGIPAVEVHLSDVDNREDFRKISYIRDVCVKTISGKGFKGYEEAICQMTVDS
jgi:3-dehydroquinate dehydratase-2